MNTAVENIIDEAVKLRHHFHMHPEPSYEEFETAKHIRKVLVERVGVDPADIRTFAGTGMTVDVKGKGPAGDSSPLTLMLRADMDALRMEESNSELPYRSVNPGVAHMCGHDGHMASLLGAAIVLKAVIDRLPSTATVRLLFQPAEEGGAGAKKMVEEGALDGVDEVYGFHNWPMQPVGTVALKSGPVMAQAGMFFITLTGRGGHGSTPYDCIDPIPAGAAIVTALQTVVSRNVAFSDCAVLSVCSFNSGTAHNVIPETCSISGTMRSLRTEVTDLLHERIDNIVRSTAMAFGVGVDIRIDRGYPPVVNHVEPTEVIRRVATRIIGADAVTDDGLPLLAGEDFSYFLNERPGCFYFVGSRFATGSTSINHSSTYNFNDESLPLAIKMWLGLLEERFGCTLFDAL